MTSEILITIKPEDEKNFLLHKKIILSELKKNIGKIKSRQEQSEILNLKLADFENGKIHLQFLKKSNGTGIGETPDKRVINVSYVFFLTS